MTIVRTAIDLFCGMGGATAGLRRAGLNVVAAVDRWPQAVEAHRRWHPNVPVIEADVAKWDHVPIPPPFLVWTSPSCKPWSVANRTKKRGEAHPEYYPLTDLVQKYARWQAKWLVIENVCGLAWSREGEEELARLDAEVRRQNLKVTFSIIPSNSVGVAQLRRRLFIVIGRSHVRIFPGSDWIPSEKAAGAVDASLPSRPVIARPGVVGDEWGRVNGAIRLKAQRAVEASEHVGRLRMRNGIPESKPHGRTLAECCDLQQVPMSVVEGLSKHIAHELVGNCVPPPLAEHAARTMLEHARLTGRLARGSDVLPRLRMGEKP